MRMRFTEARVSRLPALLATGEIVFDDDGPLAGLVLKGFSVWESKKKDGTLSVTFPSRKTNGKEYWLLRSGNDDPTPTYVFRARVVREYEDWVSRKL